MLRSAHFESTPPADADGDNMIQAIDPRELKSVGVDGNATKSPAVTDIEQEVAAKKVDGDLPSDG